jgi:hypothetical protein
MKKGFSFLLATILLMIGGCQNYDDTPLRNDVIDLKNRVAALEMWATTVNSNITALQGIVTALQDNDYVTGITSFTSPEPGGYIIAFTKGGNVTIFNGKNGNDGKDGDNGADGQDGKSPQISVQQDTEGVYYWTLNGEWIVVDGKKLHVSGVDGVNGADGKTPQMRVNSFTNIWEVSYNDGVSWYSLGVKATGEKGVTPQLRINSSNIWEASYDNGYTWSSLNVAATGADGQNGITPQIRINSGTGEWEISYDDGVSWNYTGIKAIGEKGEKGEKGDAIFANNGVNNSNSDYVEFTLADEVTKIKVPKYKLLGLDFTQPATFAAGEIKNIAYTTTGNVAIIKFLDVPNGWQATVNYTESKFMVTAPATVNDANKSGEVTILISDNVQHTIIRTITFTANTGDSDSDDATVIAIEGYSDNTMTVYYADNTQRSLTKNIDGVFAVPNNGKVIHSITLDRSTTIIIGRKADGSTIQLRLINGNLTLRDAVNEYIPIGTYSEFQLINANLSELIDANLSDRYKQEADLDLLNLEWTPIGGNPSLFQGTFDGDHHTIANLKITGNNYNAGLFGNVFNGIITNVHIISGSVSGSITVGGVCGSFANVTPYSFSNCSNASSVSGTGQVGGICGSSGSTITACYNTGSVSGNDYIGGICGSIYGAITACYNTGSVSGNGCIGGICGTLGNHISSSIIACYNIGSVSGTDQVGGICGSKSSSSYGTITACFWKDIPDDNAEYSIGADGDNNNQGSNTNTAIFDILAWPSLSIGWGTPPWKSLGGWNGGNPIYPKLHFED